VKAYFDSVQAPAKGFVVLKNAGHNAIMTVPDAFLGEMRRRVRPVTH
jgi:hypothetical protein